MTVKELINRLVPFDEDLEVGIEGAFSFSSFPIDNVCLCKEKSGSSYRQVLHIVSHDVGAIEEELIGGSL